MGARRSELLGVRSRDIAGGVVSIRGRVDRHGKYVGYGKTERSLRDVPIPEQWVEMLDRYKAKRALKVYNGGPDAYVRCTRTGRPIDRRDLPRALRKAQTQARTPDDRPTFPVLHAGRKLERGEVPDFHAFRHQAFSHRRHCENVHETYRQEIADAKRRRVRTDLMARGCGSILAA